MANSRPTPEAILRKASIALKGTQPTVQERQAFNLDWTTNGPAVALHNFSKRSLPDAQLVPFFGSWLRTGDQEGARTADWFVKSEQPFLKILTTPWIVSDTASSSRYVAADAQMGIPFSEREAWTLARFEDPRFHGILSRFDFLIRYPDTPTNKNRARASAVYRTWTCQSLAAEEPWAVPEVEDLLDTSHAGRSECASCHIRLDPLAAAFLQWPPSFDALRPPEWDPSASAKFAWVQKSKATSMGVGMLSLGEKLSGLEDVKSCVIKKSWQFVYGPSAKPDPKWSEEKLGSFGESTTFWSLVTDAISNPRFLEDRAPEKLSYSDVAGQVAVCGSCHAKESAVTQFQTLDAPFVKNDFPALLKKIVRVLRDEKTMPPPPLPKPDNLRELLKWIEQGAASLNGSPTITSDQAKEILK